MNIDTIVKQLNKDFPDIRWYDDIMQRVEGIIEAGKLTLYFKFNLSNYKNYGAIKTDILCAIKSIKGDK